MFFQTPSYLLSRRPHAAALRKLLANALYQSAKARAKRVLKGRISRLTDENRVKYNGLAGAYYSHHETEEPRVCWYKGRLTMATASAVREHTCELLVDAIRRTNASSILEVGCGDGNNLALLRDALPEARLVGCDISEGRIAFARKYHGERRLDATFEVADATCMPFEDKSFDVVFSLYCLEHLPAEFPGAVREMLRVARSKVVLIEPIPEYFGPLQRLYAFATDYVRGLPFFLDREGIDVESVELLGSAANPLNLGAMITLRP